MNKRTPIDWEYVITLLIIAGILLGTLLIALAATVIHK